MGLHNYMSVIVAIVIGVSAHNVESASAEEVPYLVSLYQGNRQFCSGAIVDDKSIVTAAYCIIDTKGYLLKDRIPCTVRAGNSEREVESVIHLKNASQSTYDLNGPHLVVLKLKESLDLDNDPTIARVKLPEAASHENNDGQIGTVSALINNELSIWNMRIVNQDSPAQGNINDSNMYALPHVTNNQRPACKFDTGAPLVVNNTLLGLEYSRHPVYCDIIRTGFVKVSAYLGFIVNAIKENYTCNMRVVKL